MNMQQMLAQAQKMQRQMEKAQAELEKKEFVVSKNGAVTVKALGSREIISISFPVSTCACTYSPREHRRLLPSSSVASKVANTSALDAIRTYSPPAALIIPASIIISLKCSVS